MVTCCKINAYSPPGQAQVHLEALEHKCEHRVAAELKDEKGRKTIGGSLEVIARLREPLTGRYYSLQPE